MDDRLRFVSIQLCPQVRTAGGMTAVRILLGEASQRALTTLERSALLVPISLIALTTKR